MFTKGSVHGICRTDRHAHQTANAQSFGQQHHPLFIDGKSAGGTRRHTSLTLIADPHHYGTCLIMNLNAGQPGIVLFEEQSGTSALAHVAGYTSIRISFQHFHRLILL